MSRHARILIVGAVIGTIVTLGVRGDRFAELETVSLLVALSVAWSVVVAALFYFIEQGREA